MHLDPESRSHGRHQAIALGTWSNQKTKAFDPAAVPVGFVVGVVGLFSVGCFVDFGFFWF